ncbi:MAG: hypothetical protein K0Q49_1636 [Haloplasmataceae bacterium]|jgi:hypothetical protein|nr:hypothetical protein [Haloplasmataceae bacterium]
MQKQDVKHLNEGLKGEHMAVLSLDNFIKDESDSYVKDKFDDIRGRHKSQAFLIKKRIEEIDGKPIKSAGFAGTMADLKYKFSPKKYKNNDILDTLISGEELGVNALNEIARELDDQKNIDLIRQIQYENTVIVDELYNLKNNYH